MSINFTPQLSLWSDKLIKTTQTHYWYSDLTVARAPEDALLPYYVYKLVAYIPQWATG
jgi:hypothetical protein